jgi:hypothetical protein
LVKSAPISPYAGAVWGETDAFKHRSLLSSG